jgi:serine O-acetyltransferase
MLPQPAIVISKMYTPLAPLIFFLSSLRLIPHVAFLLVAGVNQDFQIDMERWSEILLKEKKMSFFRRFLYLMTFFPEFRNLFYYRIGTVGVVLNLFCRQMDTLFLASPSIGPGLFIQHGFATIIAARSVGANCWVNQQVTIGYSNESDCPTIGDNVTICAGAKVIGAVIIENNAKVGANAVVVKDIPPNVTVVGVPARVVRSDNVRVDIAL